MLFDHTKIESNISRATKQFTNQDRFLYQWAEQQILDRLKDIKRSFNNTLIISDFATELENMESGDTPAQQPPHDCIISLFNLHRDEHPQNQLQEILQRLKPDGLFIGVLFGDGALKELKQAMVNTEMSLTNGCHQRTIPLMTKQQAGALLQEAGFALPVIDSETINVGYRNINSLYKDLRAMGETNSLMDRDKTILPKHFFSNVEDEYKKNFFEDKKYLATYEVIFCTGWSPHENQQQPLRPGSGQTSLKDVL